MTLGLVKGVLGLSMRFSCVMPSDKICLLFLSHHDLFSGVTKTWCMAALLCMCDNST